MLIAADRRFAGSMMLLASLAAALFLQAVLYGGNRDWVVHVFACFMLAVCGVMLGCRAVAGADLRFLTGGRLPLSLLLLSLLYVALQLVAWPPELVAALSPQIHHWWSDTAIGTGYPMTVDPESTRRHLAEMLGNTCVFLVAGCLFLGRQTRKPVIWLLLFCVLAQAAAGSGMRMSGIELFGTRSLDGHYDRARGTFINSNHFAAYLVSGACLAYSILVMPLGQRRRSGTAWDGGLTRGLLAHLDDPARLFGWACMILILLALALSGSRGAFASLLIALVVARVVVGGRSYRSILISVVVLVGLVAALVFMNASEELRFGSFSVESQLGERLPQWRMTMEAAGAYEPFGSGGGTYRWSFAPFRTGELRPLTYDHAHNDYLELLLELGLLGLLLPVAFVLAVTMRLVRTIRSWRSGFRVRVCVAAVTALAAVSVQSIVDFPMQIPALSAQLSALLGVGLAAAISLGDRHTNGSNKKHG